MSPFELKSTKRSHNAADSIAEAVRLALVELGKAEDRMAEAELRRQEISRKIEALESSFERITADLLSRCTVAERSRMRHRLARRRSR